ncbi:acyl-CoA dehydrogenase [Halioglobus japonicus]|uniref:3-methylmercaptopropionyl-CoA dehydrogenase n=1 Tax=Halioglobus japonicus TaxID=930805 RepID=A0AAP8MG50_9GAMM|nr:acyl-CoA dehydrogenase [Halioglobus japonicus]AQA19757.1 acyl-CoA dehydrogenase [Halioglobus japonicus]PLW87171.1 acyl-CoA dehydrogenase [Halioglobus japonicus]GHD09852.1 acyl-CoA dehydrogenase [Halioglobus japonicus]
MGTYRAPVEDMNFLVDEVLDVEAVLGSLPDFADYGLGPELTTALLDEAAKLAGDELAPLRRVGDEHPATCADGVVTASPGFEDALNKLGEGGWIGISSDANYGGQGLPEIYNTVGTEMWNSANLALGLAPMLSSGAALAIHAHGTEAQKQTYLEKMHTGQWMGTMNLTESGAGSDLGVMKTRAVPEGDHYRITGQKIYITWGDHQATENIIHLVLAKLPDAPAGSRGISLFIVPKFLVNEDGSLGERNDVYPVSTEHKLGIHGSPTCVMAFGDNEGAIGYLLGEENNGLACMFTMMNEARLKVGVQGLSASEGALQKAVAYARERVQGGKPIIEHADVKRMLLVMRSLTEAMRALAYAEAITMDLAHRGPQEVRGEQQRRIDLMIPVIKGWLTEVGQEVASLGVQVHGGMGYIEETGAAQYLRDVRITPIYEGTNGIQAADLVARKLGRDGGATMEAVAAEIRATIAQLEASDDVRLAPLAAPLAAALAEQEHCTQLVLAALKEDASVAMGASFEYMMQTGYLFGGWQMARSALVAAGKLAAGSDNPFYEAKIATAAFYAEQILPRCAGHAGAVAGAAGQLQSFPLEWI